MALWTEDGKHAGTTGAHTLFPLKTTFGGVVYRDDMISAAKFLDSVSSGKGASRSNHEHGLRLRLSGATLKQCGGTWGVSKNQARQILGLIDRTADRAANPRTDREG